MQLIRGAGSRNLKGEKMENEAAEAAATDQQAQDQQAGAGEAKTYTAEEVQALLQSEADKRVTAALKKAEAKHAKELQKTQSLAKLDGAEREKAEKDARISELEEMLAGYQIEKNRSEIKSVLASRGLSAEFADLLSIGEDIEAAQATIGAFDRLFKAAVKAEVEKRISGSTPKGNAGTAHVMTAQEFAALPIAEQSRLISANPEFYGKFLK